MPFFYNIAIKGLRVGTKKTGPIKVRAAGWKKEDTG